ncbi:MAG: ASKHA domain-containing protein, partial [Sedimentisphaerales bacterium]
AAGPALEGARIRCGSRAVEGAIEAVVVNEDDIVLDVIGNSPAHSICGSGLIDAVAVLLNLGIVDATGRFVEAASLEGKLSPALFSRIIEQDGQPAFVLDDTQKVILTQADIRQVQLAKAAIRAGIIFLERKLGISDGDIKQVFLAGAFGNYIRAESALRLKLLPDVPTERIRVVGNAASSGAQMILLSKQCREKARQLARKIEYIEIAHQPDFQDVFAESMAF